jgi:hypothetical protein
MEPTALLPLRRKSRYGFLSLLLIHRLQPGLHPRTLSTITIMLTITPPRTTGSRFKNYLQREHLSCSGYIKSSIFMLAHFTICDVGLQKHKTHIMKQTAHSPITTMFVRAKTRNPLEHNLQRVRASTHTTMQ